MVGVAVALFGDPGPFVHIDHPERAVVEVASVAAVDDHERRPSEIPPVAEVVAARNRRELLGLLGPPAENRFAVVLG